MSGLTPLDLAFVQCRSGVPVPGIDKHGTPVDFLPTTTRDLKVAKHFFRKILRDHSLLAPDRIGTDGAGPYPLAIMAARKDSLYRKIRSITSASICNKGSSCRAELRNEEVRALDRPGTLLHGSAVWAY